MEMEFKEPIVTLTSSTDDPLLAIYIGWHIMTDPNWKERSELIKKYLANPPVSVPGCSRYDIIPEQELLDTFRQALASPRRGVLEQVHFTFLIENVSRAFQQQLTRHRIGFSYSIQSLRMVNPGRFANEQNYHIPKRLRHPDKMDEFMNYHKAMVEAQDHYLRLVHFGVKEEDARNTLPLSVFSPLTFGCTYLALINMMAQRLCPSTQGEFRQVTRGIFRAVETVRPMLTEGFIPFCDPYQRCLVPEKKCGRWGVQWDGHVLGTTEDHKPNSSIDLMAE